MTDEPDRSEGLVSRRRFLGVCGASVAIASGGTQLTGAEESGYGAGGYGAGTYGGGSDPAPAPQLAVETIGGTAIESTSATVSGNLTELTGVDHAWVSFEWWETTSGGTQSTAEQQLETTGEFDADLSELESDTEYEVRAVATADGERATGDVVSFVTAEDDDPKDAVPEIELLTGEDVSNPRNPHVDAELTWEASIADSELWAGRLTLADDEEHYETWTYDLSGQDAGATETKRIPHGALEQGTEYTVELVLYSYYGNTADATITFESQ